MRYHITIDGQRITTKALTLGEINELYGSVKALEAQGFRLVEVKNV